MLLRTPRLILREFEETDLPAVHEFGSDPEVYRYQRFGPRTLEQSREYVLRAIARSREQPRRHYEAVVILKAEQRVIGACRLTVSDGENRQGDIGYDLNRGQWGKGLGTEAAWRLVSFGFDELKLHRICATCHVLNKASARVLEKCGMALEGRLREHIFSKGVWRDDLQYSILEQEWWGVEEH